MSQEQQEVAQYSNHIEYDVQSLHDILRMARDKARAASGLTPATCHPDPVEELTPMARAFREATHRGEEEQKPRTHAH